MTEVTVEQLYNHLKTLGKQWFYDETEMDTNVLAKSSTSGLMKNDGTVDESIYLTQHQDISGKIDSSSLSDVALSGSYADLEDVPSTFTPSAHTHSSDEFSDISAYSSLETSANASQSTINSAANTKIGALLGVELIEVTNDKGTASASTMNKLYLVPEATGATNDNYEIFVTVKTGTAPNFTYTWEKVDTARINLSGYALDTHVHGNISRDGKIGTNADYFVSTGTGGLATAQASIGNIDTSGAIGSTSGLVATTTTSGVVTTSSWITKLDGIITDLIAEGTSSATGLQDIFTLKLDLTRDSGPYQDHYFLLCYNDMSFVTTNPSGSYTIDWGDGTVETIIGTYDSHGDDYIDHEYDLSLTSATITIPNVVAIPYHILTAYNISDYYLDEVTIPTSATDIENVFGGVDGNNVSFKVNLMWDSANNIPTAEYVGLSSYNEDNITEITIPNGTTSLYVAKGYPSAQLVERSA